MNQQCSCRRHVILFHLICYGEFVCSSLSPHVPIPNAPLYLLYFKFSLEYKYLLVLKDFVWYFSVYGTSAIQGKTSLNSRKNDGVLNT